MNLRKTLFSLIIILSVLPLSCIEKIDRQGKVDFARYLPLHDGDQYFYSGPAGKAVITGNINDLYTITFFDSTDNVILWADLKKTESGIGWKNIAYPNRIAPSISFEPPLPVIPWSNVVGDTLLFSSAAIYGDSLNTHERIQVQYEVVANGAVTTRLGSYADCIQLRLSFVSLYNDGKKVIKQDCYWWLAYDIGIVKYVIPGGAGELMKARIDGKILP
jgi:hypothetical protein